MGTNFSVVLKLPVYMQRRMVTGLGFNVSYIIKATSRLTFLLVRRVVAFCKNM